MPSNDECVFGIPSIQCPSCGYALEMTMGNRVEKLSKRQRKAMFSSTNTMGSTKDRFAREPDCEDLPSERPELTFQVVTCGNMQCEQYNKIKVLEVPRIKTPSVRVEL